MTLDFAYPRLLLLLPLAMLPLGRRSDDVLTYAYIAWLPEDAVGRLVGAAWRALAVITIVAIVLGLSGLGQSETSLLRTGRGAEIAILLDRSASMDAVIKPLNSQVTGELASGTTKKQAVRDSLTHFIAKRPHDRYALTLFSTVPMRVIPFTEDTSAILAGLAATAVGRGLAETNMGPALLDAIGEFDDRPYSGSRVILLVSDGGAQLDAETQQRIKSGLARDRIGLYFIYIRSGPNSPDLLRPAQAADDSVDEVALHRYFQGLPTPYHVYQADNAESVAAAIAEIDKQQNLPLSFRERVPRIDHSGACYCAALCAAALLLGLHLLQIKGWT